MQYVGHRYIKSSTLPFTLFMILTLNRHLLHTFLMAKGRLKFSWNLQSYLVVYDTYRYTLLLYFLKLKEEIFPFDIIFLLKERKILIFAWGLCLGTE